MATNQTPNPAAETSEQPARSNRRLRAILLSIQFIISAVFLYFIISLDMLPSRYVTLLVIALVALLVLFFILQSYRKIRGVGYVFSILLSIVMLLGTTYVWKADQVMDRLTLNVVYKVSDISVIALNTSSQALESDQEKDFGFMSARTASQRELILTELQTAFPGQINVIEYNGIADQVKALYQNEVDAIVVDQAFRSMIDEIFPTLKAESSVVEEFTYTEEIILEPEEEEKEESSTAAAETTEMEPFTVFLSGNDAFGEVMLSDGRTDVNILATVNPNTRHIVLTTTPRDYYVELPFYEGCWDKLTHAGIYGIDCSMETLENLYDIEIDYYARVNFTGFQSIVDALGGVQVYSEYDFTVGPYHYVHGYNRLDGAAALSFVRERYSFESGDVQRGKNQMAMISAIIDKITSPAILTNYMDLMDSLSDCFVTDIPRDRISELVKLMIDDPGRWTIESNTVHGYGDMRTTYSIGSMELSVMLQDADAVQAAHDMIAACIAGEEPLQ